MSTRHQFRTDVRPLPDPECEQAALPQEAKGLCCKLGKEAMCDQGILLISLFCIGQTVL